jgi:predicted aspartyl protease
MTRFIPGKDYYALTYTSDGMPREIITDAKVRVPEIFSGMNHEYVATKALWDTGATHSVVSPELAQRLGLPQVGRAQTAGVHGVQTVAVFALDILLMDRVAFTS